jgi:hypothetical protein
VARANSRARRAPCEGGQWRGTTRTLLIAFNEFVNDAGDEVTVVQIHPDAASMEAHMEIVRERAQEAYAETLDATVRIQVFGLPTEAILEALRQ